MSTENLAIFSSLIVAVIGLIIFFVRHRYSYWERKKITFLKPKFPLGNIKGLVPKGIGLGKISYDFYQEFRKMGSRFGGVYIGLDPALVLMDPEDVKSVFIRDFDHFVDRGIYMTEKVPITVNIFAQTGNDWKNVRQKLSVLFTASKMKMYFGIMKNCCAEAEPLFEEAAEKKSDVDIIEIMACFTTDVIGNVIYGINCNSLKNPKAEFRTMGRRLFEDYSLIDQIRLCLTVYYPRFSCKVGITNIQVDIDKFFTETVRATMEYREKNNINRQDLLQALIDMKNKDNSLTIDEIIAQTFLFFSAGYETSSTTMTLACYELGKRQDIQDKVRSEILEVLSKYDNEMTYDALNDMKYLQQVFEETMRMWPVLATIPRVCEKDYRFNNSDFTVEAGTRILIPCLGMHRDSKYYEDASTWNPDRFNNDPRRGQKYIPYFGFGDGPRNCIGARFGTMQFKIGLVTLLRSYRIHVSPKTVEPLEINPETFVMHTMHKIYLNLEKL